LQNGNILGVICFPAETPAPRFLTVMFMVQSACKTIRIDDGETEVELAQARIDRLLMRSVRVNVRDDDLVLTGSVNTWHEKQLAQELVREVHPGLRIRNQLSLALR